MKLSTAWGMCLCLITTMAWGQGASQVFQQAAQTYLYPDDEARRTKDLGDMFVISPQGAEGEPPPGQPVFEELYRSCRAKPLSKAEVARLIEDIDP